MQLNTEDTSYKIRSAGMLIRSILIVSLILIFASCGEEKKEIPAGDGKGVAYEPQKDREIQMYNLNRRKELSQIRSDCDTIALMEHILNSYPEGTYLVTTDRKGTYDIPDAAVIYYEDDYIFAVTAESGEGERLIETKNIIGFDQSFIDYDSTELGTPYFNLVLFKCEENQFRVVWETPVPSHGGFNTITLSEWKNKILKISLRFYYAYKRGHIDYNYYLLNGINLPPHLLMTYSGIDFKRTEADINKDNYPDFYEHIFYNLEQQIIKGDSVGFVWKPEDSLYVNRRNRNQTRPY